MIFVRLPEAFLNVALMFAEMAVCRDTNLPEVISSIIDNMHVQ